MHECVSACVCVSVCVCVLLIITFEKHTLITDMLYDMK